MPRWIEIHMHRLLDMVLCLNKFLRLDMILGLRVLNIEIVDVVVVYNICHILSPLVLRPHIHLLCHFLLIHLRCL